MSSRSIRLKFLPGNQASTGPYEKGIDTLEILKISLNHIFSIKLHDLAPVKAGVHVKAVLTSLNTAFLPISRSRH